MLDSTQYRLYDNNQIRLIKTKRKKRICYPLVAIDSGSQNTKVKRKILVKLKKLIKHLSESNASIDEYKRTEIMHL